MTCGFIIVASAAAPSAPAVAAPVACAWQAAGERVLADVARSAEPSDVRVRAALDSALAGCRRRAQRRPYFAAADWLWAPIGADPVLDPDSAAFVQQLATGQHIVNIGDFGVTLVGLDAIRADTPRFPVRTTADFCRDNPIRSAIPVPAGTAIAPGSDGHLAIADPQSRTVFNLWVAKPDGDAYSAGCGTAVPFDGDGRETTGGSSTGSAIARFAAVGRIDEVGAGVIPHALFFSTDMAKEHEFRFPAAKTDGANNAHVATPIPEGARVQLDPTLDIDALGLTPAEATIARALQTYGAYVGDNGGARIALLFEYGPDSPVYRRARLDGGAGGFAPLEKIPWNRLRVLAAWDGSGGDRS